MNTLNERSMLVEQLGSGKGMTQKEFQTGAYYYDTGSN
jgi:hypothetical protein